MTSSSLGRSRSPLTGSEKWMVINAYRYFSGATSFDKQNQSISLRKRVALVLGVAESTVGAVLSD